MKFTLSFAAAILLSSCFGLNNTQGGRSVTGADSFAPYGGAGIEDGQSGSLFGAEDPNAAIVQRSRARYGTLFLAETKPWMVGSVQEQVPHKHALPGSGWRGRAPQTPVIDDYSMGSGGQPTATK
ncbi:MAG: hypothetical protein HS117_17360 [Verrucomicrobiaceae bacterium]|jgi:hypothetical protein|nr:hypothetical protein [Verrucomicrobiaceae bacterium]